MNSAAVGDLVEITTDGPTVDGIVFDTPSAKKVVVAVIDPRRGPVFRTVHPAALGARETEGANDRALRQLIRRTPAPRRGAHGGASVGRGEAGVSRPATHRSS